MMRLKTVTWHYISIFSSYILMKHFIFHMTELVLAIIRLHEVSEYDAHVHTEVTLSALLKLHVLIESTAVSVSREKVLLSGQEIMLSNQSSRSSSVTSCLVASGSLSTSGFVSFRTTV